MVNNSDNAQYDTSNTCRMEKQIIKLEKRWKQTEFEMVLKPISELKGMNNECNEVINILMEWMINNRGRG